MSDLITNHTKRREICNGLESPDEYIQIPEFVAMRKKWNELHEDGHCCMTCYMFKRFCKPHGIDDGLCMSYIIDKDYLWKFRRT